MSDRTVKVSVMGVVGLLAVIEFTSGVLQGYYTPLLTDIARHLEIHDADVNWFEGAQLMVSALIIPAFAKLGDMVGHRRMLLISTAVTAVAGLAVAVAPTFLTFLIAWAFQGFYVVWLPLEIALIFSYTRGLPNAASLTRRAAALLVAALELGAIAGALAGGALGESLPLWLVLLVPAIVVVICFFVILFGVKEGPVQTGGRLDSRGLVILSLSLVAVTGGLSFLRLNGVGDPLAWGLIALGAVLLVPFVLVELRMADPLIDIRMLAKPEMWPVQLTAGLFGMSVLGAQGPLSTFARTDRETYGYGLSAGSGLASILIGAYVLSLAVGALLFPLVARLINPRRTLIGASLLVAVGYGLLIPLHGSMIEVLTSLIVAGIGSGALVAALPSAAASVAPFGQTGVATGLTNTTKTLGGAIASCIFGLALFSGAPTGDEATAGSLSGYIIVWSVCAGSALLAAIALLVVPKQAFRDAQEIAPAETSALR